MNINDYVTYIDNEEDVPYLRTKLLDVNMRLFKTSTLYKGIIFEVCNYIRFVAKTTMDGYKKPHGMSGANLAIPFNIIGIVRNRGKDNEWVEIMINPKIISSGINKSKSLSNCGSIRLKEPIEVERYEDVGVMWYNENGEELTKNFSREEGGFTIQHEIEHNLGILITDPH